MAPGIVWSCFLRMPWPPVISRRLDWAMAWPGVLLRVERELALGHSREGQGLLADPVVPKVLYRLWANSRSDVRG
jgi:hypothetical protein